MNNYRDQNGCYRCTHVFRVIHYDDAPELFCLLNAPERPSCGLSLMDEEFPEISMPDEVKKIMREKGVSDTDYTEEEKRIVSEYLINSCNPELQDKWNAWAKKRSVQDFGICDDFQKEEGGRGE